MLQYSDMHPYQYAMVEHLVSTPRGNLFCPLGAGKTVSILTALTQLAMVEDDVFPCLVLGPLRVARSVWPEEPKKWAHLKRLSVMPILGTEAERRRALGYRAQVFTVNYENLVWLVEQYKDRDWPFKTVVADEVTALKAMRLKQGSKRGAAIRSRAFSGITRWWGLSGTPCANGLKDLWAVLWMCDGGSRLGKSYSAFSARWFSLGYDGYSIKANDYAQEQIKDAIKDICLSIDMKDWMPVEDAIVTNIYVDLPVKARLQYKQMEKELFCEIAAHGVTALNAAAKTNKLLQFASGAVYTDPSVEGDDSPGAKVWKEVHDEKLLALDSVIEEAAGAPVLVIYEFKSDLARILKRYKNARVLDKKTQTIEDWNAGRIDILAMHPAAGGHGISLQHGGCIMVFLGQSWDLEKRTQAEGRICPLRQKQSGYDRSVFIYNILARDTVDELVMERVETKKSVQDILLGALRRKQSCVN